MTNCIFCKIIAGEIPSAKVAETETLFAFEDINPEAPTHVLIIPKKHIASGLELKEDDKSVIGEVFLLANQIAKDKGIDKSGFRVVTNTGKDAGQAVDHIHFHLLGGRPMKWPPG